MPFCSNCGQPLPENAKFCGTCGTPVSNVISTPETAHTNYASPEPDTYRPPVDPSYHPPVEPSYQPAYSNTQGCTASVPPLEEPVKKRKKGPIIGIACVAVVIIAVVLFLLFGGGGANRFVGYWECDSISVDGAAPEDEFFDIDVDELFAFMLYDDGTFDIFLFDEMTDGKWVEGEDCVIMTVDGESITLPFVDDKLVMDLSEDGDDIVLYFEFVSTSAPATFGDAAVNEPAAEAPAEEAAPEDPAEPPDEPPAEEAAPPEEPARPDVSTQLGAEAYHDFGDYTVEILGGQPCSDDYTDNCFRVFYRFTNYSDEPQSAWMAFYFYAYQNGSELETEWMLDGPEEDNYYSYYVMPGTTIICTEVFQLIDDSPIDFYICEDWELDETECAYASFSANEDTASGIHHEFIPVSDPEWTDGMSDEADWDSAYVFINSAESADSWGGSDDLIRVYYDWTNKSSDAESFWMAGTVLVFQDDVQLGYGFPDESLVSDEMFTSNIEPGASKTVSECYELRSDSPVVVLIYNWEADEYIGCTFYLD